MKRCLIHIGMQKTGSTSIQQSLDEYSDDRFFYARLGSANHGPAMLSLFSPDNLLKGRRFENRKSFDVASYTARMERALNASIASAAGRTLMVSGEIISVMPPEGLVRLRDGLLAHFDEIVVAGYVRPPEPFMSSRFQQRVISGAVSEVNLARQYPRYRRTFGAFDEVFGRDRVHLWKFDPAAFPGGCVVRDFCSRFGIELPEERIVRRNDSLPGHAIALLYAYRKMAPRCGFPALPGREAHRIGDRLAVLGGGKFRFAREAISPILELRHRDIAWMERRLGASLRDQPGVQPGGVRDENDLLMPDPAVASRLLKLVGSAAPADNQARTLEDVVRLVHVLREQCVKHDALPALS